MIYINFFLYIFKQFCYCETPVKNFHHFVHVSNTDIYITAFLFFTVRYTYTYLFLIFIKLLALAPFSDEGIFSDNIYYFSTQMMYESTKKKTVFCRVEPRGLLTIPFFMHSWLCKCIVIMLFVYAFR